MSCRNLIPKNGGGYLLYFLAAAGMLAGMLYYYCVPPAIDGAGQLAFLDLTARDSLFRWFVSIVWLMIAGMSFVLMFFSCALRGGGLKSVFWCSVGSVAFVLSVDTVCSFLPFLKKLLDQKVMEYSGDEASSSMTFWILGIISFLFVLSEVCFLWRYIRSMYGHRLTLKFFFSCSALLLIAAVVFHCAIPAADSDTNAAMAHPAQGTSQRAERLAPAPKKPEKPAAERNNRGGAPGTVPNGNSPDETDEADEAEDDFRYVAYETPAESNSAAATAPQTGSLSAGSLSAGSKTTESERMRVKRWEDIFGWEKTAEEYLGMKVDIEEVLGLDASVEELLFGSDATLDLVRTREALRQGTYGFFLLFFSMGLGLLARAERLGIDKQIKMGRYNFINHPERMLADDL